MTGKLRHSILFIFPRAFPLFVSCSTVPFSVPFPLLLRSAATSHSQQFCLFPCSSSLCFPFTFFYLCSCSCFLFLVLSFCLSILQVLHRKSWAHLLFPNLCMHTPSNSQTDSQNVGLDPTHGRTMKHLIIFIVTFTFPLPLPCPFLSPLAFFLFHCSFPFLFFVCLLFNCSLFSSFPFSCVLSFLLFLFPFSFLHFLPCLHVL